MLTDERHAASANSPLRTARTPKARSIARVLVFRIGQLGDTLVSLPAIQAIRARHPDAELILVTEKQPPERVFAWDVLGPTGLFSSVLTYDASLSFPTGAIAALWLAVRIRRRRVRTCYYLSPPQRSRRQIWRDRLFYQVICGIADVRGLTVTGDVPRTTTGAPIRQPPEALRLTRLVDDVAPVLPVTPAVGHVERSVVDAFWREEGIPLDASVLAFGVGAKDAATQWPFERFDELAGRVLEAWPNARLLVVGSLREAELSDRLRRKHGERVVNAATRMKIWESAEALRRCVLYVGNNSGAMHLAAVMGTPCIAISSARDLPGMWEPQGAGHVTLYRHVPCAGCLLSTCTTMGLICLTQITVDEVLAACASVLAHRTLSEATHE